MFKEFQRFYWPHNSQILKPNSINIIWDLKVPNALTLNFNATTIDLRTRGAVKYVKD